MSSNRSKRFLAPLFAVVVASIAPTTANAAGVIFNNIFANSGGADSFTLFGPLAQSFIASGTVLTDVKLRLEGDNQTSGSITVQLFDDNGGPSPGTLVGTVGNLSDSFLTNPSSIFDFPVSLPIISGARYWIQVTASGGSSAAWSTDIDYNGTGVPGEYILNSGTVYDIVNEVGVAYQMQLSSIPEPATLALMSLGLVGLGFGKRRKLF